MEESLDFLRKLHKTCRICFEESDNLSPIFENNNETPKYPGLVKKIRECCDVELSEGISELSIPSFICDNCIENAKISYKFRLQCRHSETTLQLYHEELIQSNLEILQEQESSEISDVLSHLSTQDSSTSNETDVEYENEDDNSDDDRGKKVTKLTNGETENGDLIVEQLLEKLIQPSV
ncbi:uncharacterized protein LOC130673090 [Microplitis mediator]|uniref:uncharacterized protein LOC130673090 n=1 Tax=Microplitis mediator TaxID=375433 RepID=UPI002552862E|nr:uncharacterized protein LOC130673090 [Microplitis mediator]